MSSSDIYHICIRLRQVSLISIVKKTIFTCHEYRIYILNVYFILFKLELNILLLDTCVVCLL